MKLWRGRKKKRYFFPSKQDSISFTYYSFQLLGKKEQQEEGKKRTEEDVFCDEKGFSALFRHFLLYFFVNTQLLSGNERNSKKS